MGWGGCMAWRGGGQGAKPAAAGFGERWVKAAHHQCLHGVLQELSVPEGLGKEGGCKGAVLCRAAGTAPCIARCLCAPAGLGAGQQCLWGEKGKGRGLQSSGSPRAHRPSLGVPVVLAGCVVARCSSGVTVLLLPVPIPNVGRSLQRRQRAALRNETSVSCSLLIRGSIFLKSPVAGPGLPERKHFP